MTILILNPPNPPQKLATLSRQKIHLTVLTAGRVVRFSKERYDLDKPPITGGISGLTVTDVTGTVEVEWEGDLWALGASANAGPSQLELSL